MRKVTVEDWCSALLSKKYWQGKINLYDSGSNTYCVLGVAVDLADDVESYKGPQDIADVFQIVNSFHSSLDDLLTPEIQTYLAYLNDQGAPFSILAMEIRALASGNRSRFNDYLKLRNPEGVTMANHIINSITKVEA